jgi:hypothetical protein
MNIRLTSDITRIIENRCEVSEVNHTKELELAHKIFITSGNLHNSAKSQRVSIHENGFIPNENRVEGREMYYFTC